jgi:hypothetical protein
MTSMTLLDCTKTLLPKCGQPMTMMHSMSQVSEKEMVTLAQDTAVEEEGMETDAVEEEVDKVAEAAEAEETTSKSMQAKACSWW